jgi:hypothetical protein
MKADRVEVSWDEQKKKWLARIVVGEEVIRRYFEQAKDSGQESLRSAAEKTAVDEGYQVESANVILR